jgi:hypothetical protein
MVAQWNFHHRPQRPWWPPLGRLLRSISSKIRSQATITTNKAVKAALHCRGTHRDTMLENANTVLADIHIFKKCAADSLKDLLYREKKPWQI